MSKKTGQNRQPMDGSLFCWPANVVIHGRQMRDADHAPAADGGCKECQLLIDGRLSLPSCRLSPCRAWKRKTALRAERVSAGGAHKPAKGGSAVGCSGTNRLLPHLLCRTTTTNCSKSTSLVFKFSASEMRSPVHTNKPSKVWKVCDRNRPFSCPARRSSCWISPEL